MGPSLWVQLRLLKQSSEFVSLLLKLALLLLPFLLCPGPDEGFKARLPLLCVQQHVARIEDKLWQLLIPC